MGKLIKCDICGEKEIPDEKCISCNGTGLIITNEFFYKVPSDFNKNICDIYNDRIQREIIEISKLAKIDVELKQDTNNYKQE